MKYHRHLHFGHNPNDETEASAGEGDGTVYFLDDGWKRCMVGRIVGGDPEGVTYCLVGNLDYGTYAQYMDPECNESTDSVFNTAKDIILCSVFEDEDVSNVVDAQRFRKARDVPRRYLPPSPYQSQMDVPS